MADAATQADWREEYRRLRLQGVPRAQAVAQVRDLRQAPRTAPAPDEAQRPVVHGSESLGRGAVQGATMGFADEWRGAAEAAGRKVGEWVSGVEGKPYADRYREIRNDSRAANDAARQANPKTYLAGNIAGGVAGAAALPAAGVLRGAAVLGKAAAAGAGYGAVGGLGASGADLTKGEVVEAAKDTAIGAAFGVAGGVGGQLLGKGAAATGQWLKSLGRARLFKAAVGQNKRAFTQVTAKGLFDKSAAYLDDLGIGVGDTTESIGAKLSKRSKSINDALDGMVSSLDQVAPASVPVATVVRKIEKEVAEPLKKLAANQSEYQQVKSMIEHIKGLGNPKGSSGGHAHGQSGSSSVQVEIDPTDWASNAYAAPAPKPPANISFAEAAAQRRAVQQQINYDKIQGRDAAADAKKRIAQIWNEVIDETAEPVLKKLGERGDAYRELRHEYALVQELSGHVSNRMAGNAANRVVSASDYGAGGVAGVMSGDPLLGLAAATANHVSRVYGNAAAGRGAINVARLASGSPRALEILAPSMVRAASARDEDDEEPPQPVGARRGGI